MTKNKTTNKTTPKNTKPRAKTIKLKDVKAQHKVYTTPSVFVLDKEKNLQIKYYEKFSDDKINEVMQEAYESLLYVEENELKFFEDDMQFLQYLHFLIARKFTSLESEIPADFSSHVSIMSQIIEIGLFNRIFDEILDPAEVEKVIYKFEQLIATVSKIGEITTSELQKLEENLQNTDLMKKISDELKLSDSNG